MTKIRKYMKLASFMYQLRRWYSAKHVSLWKHNTTTKQHLCYTTHPADQEGHCASFFKQKKLASLHNTFQNLTLHAKYAPHTLIACLCNSR